MSGQILKDGIKKVNINENDELNYSHRGINAKETKKKRIRNTPRDYIIKKRIIVRLEITRRVSKLTCFQKCRRRSIRPPPDDRKLAAGRRVRADEKEQQRRKE